MILFVEGPRHSGKTFLIKQFIEQANDDRLEYYKFYFANHIKTLGLTEKDASPEMHYFSLGNIMTIMEMNGREEYRDKIWVFDRAIISAYTWAILRGRLSKIDACTEYQKLLCQSSLYQNCKTLVVSVEGQTDDSQRSKDIWDGVHSTEDELALMNSLIGIGRSELNYRGLGNEIQFVNNRFDQNSITDFNAVASELIGLNK